MTIQIDENHPAYREAKAKVDADRLSRAVFVEGVTLPQAQAPAQPSKSTDSKAKD